MPVLSPSSRSVAQATAAETQSLITLNLQTLWRHPDLAGTLPPLMIWGPPGIGKSAVVRAVAEQEGIGFIDLRLSQRDPVDLRGIPVPRDDRTDWLLSGDWPREPEGRGILLFDELTAADRSVQVAAYEMILDRRLGALYSLPPGWYIVAAGNRQEDLAVASGLSSALANRFCHLEMAADAEDWLRWAEAARLHPHVISFIRHHPDRLFGMPDDEAEASRGWPSPRSWERVSTQVRLIEACHPRGTARHRLIRLTVGGLVGQGEAAAFLRYQANLSGLPDPLTLLMGTGPWTPPADASDRFALTNGLVTVMRQRLAAGHGDGDALMERFFTLCEALPDDFAMRAVTLLLKDQPPEMVERLTACPGFATLQARTGEIMASSETLRAAQDAVADILGPEAEVTP